MDTLADKFFDWGSETGVRFKDEEHRAVAGRFSKQFGDCVESFEYVQRSWDGDGSLYDTVSVIRFNDGSKAAFNYKGEGE